MTAPVALASLEILADGLDHPEGVAVAPDGAVFAGGEAGQVYRIDGDGSWREVANTGGSVLGLAFDGAGRLYACDGGLHAVMRIDVASGTVETFSDGTAERPMRVPNWGAFDAAGNYYVSDSGDWDGANGVVWVVRPGGRAEVWTEQAPAFPNGLALAADGSRIYLAESGTGRVIEIPIESDGGAGRVQVLCELGLGVPDGIAVAADGSLVIACYRPDAIYRWSVGAGLDVLASDPRGIILSAPTNAAFAGAELDELVVANLAGNHVTRCRLDVRGTALFRPAAERVDGDR